MNYYDAGTWAIIQAFTSPLSIFYRFHSSVCLADIWQEAYDDSHVQERVRMTGKKGMQSFRMTDSDHFSPSLMAFVHFRFITKAFSYN